MQGQILIENTITIDIMTFLIISLQVTWNYFKNCIFTIISVFNITVFKKSTYSVCVNVTGFQKSTYSVCVWIRAAHTLLGPYMYLMSPCMVVHTVSVGCCPACPHHTLQHEKEECTVSSLYSPNTNVKTVFSPYSPNTRVGRQYFLPMRMLSRMPTHTSIRPIVESSRKLTMYLENNNYYNY